MRVWLLLTLLIDLFGPVSYFQFRFSLIWLRKKQQATGGGGGTQLYEDCFSFQNRFSPSARDEQQTPSLEGTALPMMERVRENIIDLVKQNPAGIPLKKLAVFYNQQYRENLSLSSLGFDSMVSLITSLDSHLVLVGQMVRHKDHLAESKAKNEAGATAKAAEQEVVTTQKILENIVALIEGHPEGILLKKLAVVYRRKYKHSLVLAPLGFKTISSLVASLKALVVQDDVVFHQSHELPKTAVSKKAAKNDSRPATPQRTQSPRPPVSAPLVDVGPPSVTAPSPLEKRTTLTQDQLYQRVIEVITEFKLTAPSMDQLQYHYFQHFGEQLPLTQYMSLYDTCQTSNHKGAPSPPGTSAQPFNSVPETPTAGTDPVKKSPKTQAQQQQQQQQQQQGPASNHSTASDMTKEHISKLRGAPLKESSASVFREAYHAQLREVHGANMRAMEAVEGSEGDPAERRWRRALNPDTVNTLMEDVMRDIAAEGELVTKDKVVSKVCMLMDIPSLEAGGIKHWMTQALKDLQYSMREINMFIECTDAVTSICTLYELGKSLASLKDKKHYEELKLGPLCKLPLIHRMFKIDSNTRDDDIHQIETVDILKHLRMFRKQQTKPRVDLPEFMKYLADHYNCESPYELGIRIHSIGLPISTLMKVSRSEHAVLEQGREVIQKELEEETNERLRKIKRSILEPLQGSASILSMGNMERRKKYASMTAAEVVLEVFTNAEGVFAPRMARHVQSFLQQVTDNRLARSLFQLAICGGSLAVPHDLVPKDKASKTSDQMKTEDTLTASLPSEAKVKQYIKDSVSSQNSTFTLLHLASLEKKLAKHFQVKDFRSLEQGNFLEFLVKHIQLLQDSLGSALILGSGTMELAGNGFRPTRQDVFEFINQCGDIPSTDPDELSHVESALRCHYRVRDSRDLGYGPLHTLAGLVQRQRSLAGGGLSTVFYESALFAKHCKSRAESGCEAVGHLGEMSKAQALASLLSCPLLEDLSEWSQWELIFKPQHDSLKEFIERNAANTGLAALEVTPGSLLRITSHTGDKHFASAAASLDPVGTAGHLVSMVVADGPVNAPIALLANHMQSSLAAAVVKEDLSLEEDDVSRHSQVAKFLLACLTRIPSRMCQALMQQVFLEPFSRVLGQARSKKVLITVAQSDARHLSCLHRLGVLLGITDWVKDYQRKLNPSQSHNGISHMAPLEQIKSNLIDSQSSSLSALNTSEDEYLEDSSQNSNSGASHQSSHQVNGTQDEEEEEELYELRSPPNGEMSDVSSEPEEGQDTEREAKMPDAQDEDAAGSSSEATVDQHRAIIEDIRKSEFGIGVELNAEGQKLMKVHQDRLGRSLDRLSTELYSKDTHFVLELIQNADDNSYPLDGVQPALAFVVETNCITILNNEVGFQEKNIRAICDVGRSTKGKHKYGYIGQKGIGFKSVFKVTDCPEIHSSGFHLRFDKTCGPMGYILPHWADNERPLDTKLEEINQHSWTTKICLPLRAESHQTRNLFHDVHPSLLLFLHRLRSITIYKQREKSLVTMTRKDLSHNVLEVEHTDGTERWLVVKTTLQPKKIKEDVESTELALAFQLNSNQTDSDITHHQPQKQPVFAYLPLRSFGFRFIIQGDFDIPSSREDVDRDSSWNQWLRSEIPQLFLQAMNVFTEHPEFRGLKGLCRFLHFIPLPDEVLDFFKPVAGQIIQLLKGEAFLPTLSSDGKVVKKLPSQVAICQDAVIRDVIGGDELERHLSLSYLHPDVAKAPPTSLLAHLGVRYLRGSDVSTVTTAMAKELVRAEGINSGGGLRQLARLLVCNFRAMEHGYEDADSVLRNLRSLPIIPLADGRVVALSEEGVFFPMEEDQTSKKKSPSQTGALSALYRDINVVLPDLLSCVESLESQQVRELLKRLGVHEMQPQELLEQHIYPAIRSSKWKSKPEEVVVSYLVFIKQHSASRQEYAEISVPVLTSKGLLCPASERVHFSTEYSNMDLPKCLPGCDWVLLSPRYVATDGDVAGWRELFSKLGVRDGLVIRKERQTLTAKDLESSPWSVESKTWNLSPGEGCELDDYPCEEFQALATAELPGSVLLTQREALLQLLVANWDTGHRYSQYLTAQVLDSDGREIRGTKSSFQHCLRSLKWLPAYRPLEGNQVQRSYLLPSSVYLSSRDVHSLLGNHVYYVDISPCQFSMELGMRHSVSVEDLINYLKKWCIKPAADPQEQRLVEDELEGGDFTSTVEHIHKVYSYLYTNCPQGRLKELFHHNPAVFIEYNRRDGNWCSGRFYHLKEVCWADPTAMFQRYKQLTHAPDCPIQEPKVLAPFYKQLEVMRDFFLSLNVDRSPNMNQYVGLLELICASSPIPTAEVLQDVSVLYARLAQKCKIQMSGEQQDNNTESKLNHSYCSTLKGMVSDKKVFPTKDNKWVSLAPKPMIADTKELEKVFKHHKEICLLHLPPAERKPAHKNKTGNFAQSDRGEAAPAFSEEDRSLFLKICGIQSLSQCVKTQPQTESLRPSPTVQNTVHLLVPYIQRFLLHHDELAHVYAELLERNIGERLKKLSFVQVGKLYIHYQLKVGDSEVVEMQDIPCLLKEEKELCIQKDHILDTQEICSELVKLFCAEQSHRKELLLFLRGLITSLDDPRALQKFLRKEDVDELPSGEQVWEVPEADFTFERALSRSNSTAPSAEEPSRPAPEDGEEGLACWPPRSSVASTGAARKARSDNAAVDAVLKMWPPPAPPKDPEPERDAFHGASGQPSPSSGSGSGSSDVTQPPKARRPAEQPSPQRNHPAPPGPPEPQQQHQRQTTETSQPPTDGEETAAAAAAAAARPPSGQPVEAASSPPPPNSLVVPDAVVLSGTFQGSAAATDPSRLLNLDFPQLSPQTTLEDLELHCQRPTTVVLSDKPMDLTAIGVWGEQLVNSFLCDWRDGAKPGRPTQVLWCNGSGESGQPYDFKLSFGPSSVVYVEVKATVKRDRSFIHLSANELDFALRERERYHIFRVYSAGDAQNARLCRIQNLAQHLHTKDLALYLFV